MSAVLLGIKAAAQAFERETGEKLRAIEVDPEVFAYAWAEAHRAATKAANVGRLVPLASRVVMVDGIRVTAEERVDLPRNRR